MLLMKFFEKLVLILLVFNTSIAIAQCDTDISICTPGVAGPFNFSTPSVNPSSCLDYWNGDAAPNYAYIILYITSSGPLNLLIDGDLTTGCLDVAIFDITGQADPCGSLGLGTELSCNYASNCDGCSEFGSTFPGCLSEVAAPIVSAGDILMILVEDWSGTASSFTLELDSTGAQTGPGDPTITPAGPLNTTDPSVIMTAVNGGGTWSSDCGACIDPVTGEFDPVVAGDGTHEICYELGTGPCLVVDCIDVVVGTLPCFFNGISANGAITCPSTTYSTTGVLTFQDAPTSGTLTVTDCNGNDQVFNAPFTSPQNYTLIGQTADGLACDITAVFSADVACTITANSIAPICPCVITGFNVVQGDCIAATDTYSMSGTVTFDMPPTTGVLTVSVDNGTTTYDTVINVADFISPLSFSVSGIPSDQAGSTITAVFSADSDCISAIPYTAPICTCEAEIGTFSTSDDNVTNTDYVLCFGDSFNYQSNGDYTPPADIADGDPYNPGIGFLIYSCPPTPGVEPINDLCFEGLVTDGTGALLFNDLNDLGWINAYPAGTFANNTIYYVPITMYDIAGNIYSNVILPNPSCYDLGPTVVVQYLPEIKFLDVEDCQAGSIAATINGGLPEIEGSNFTAVPGSLIPLNASFDNTTAANGGTITINGLTNGQNYSYNVMDDNGCSIVVSGTFIGTEDPGFNYDNYTICTEGADPVVSVTGDAGTFSFALTDGVGPTLSINTTTGAVDASASDPGTYEITYTTNDVTCFSDSVVTMVINLTPIVDPELDQTVCAGADFVDINFTGTVGATFEWTNDNTTIGLIANGNGNIVGFTGANISGVQTIGIITVTPSTAECIGSGSTFNLSVDPIDVATFEYVDGLTYCASGLVDPTVNITGTTGGTFSFSINSGGPNLAFDTNTGGIDLSASDVGSYDIQYLTNGVCPEISTLTVVISDAPVADIVSGVYCHNDDVNSNDVVTYINGGSGGLFTAVPTGLVINSLTGSVDVAASTVGEYTITNTIDLTAQGCALVSVDSEIIINALPTAYISGTTTICPSDPLPDLQVEFTSVGDWDLTYAYNGVEQTVTGSSPLIMAEMGFGSYELVNVTDGNGCINSLSGIAIIDSFLIPVIHPFNDYILCEGDELVLPNFFSLNSNDFFEWQMTTGTNIGFGTNGEGNIPSFVSSNCQTVTIEVTPLSSVVDGSCYGDPIYFDVVVSALPTVNISADRLNGCAPTTIEFTDLVHDGQIYDWTFGDGAVGSGNPLSHTYEAGGLYDVGLTVTSADGCVASGVEIGYINITSMPIADFSLSPQITDVSHTEIEFTNESINGDEYEWDFGDETGLSNHIDPTHVYADVPNQYAITLWAFNNDRVCKDSIQKFITINDVLLYYVPNVFTPDQDAYNETFKPIFTSGFDPFDYHLMIFNRWGEIIFESHDARYGWDGTYSDDEELCTDGVYVWKISFAETMTDKRHDITGHVSLLK